MSQSLPAYFDEPTPLLPVAFPRRITRPRSTMTCPECELRQSVALDCAGCGRIMKPATDFRLADPMLAPGLEAVEPVEAPGAVSAPASRESTENPAPASTFRAVVVEEPEAEGLPWVKMGLSLVFCWMAWQADQQLGASDLPVWLDLSAAVLGGDGTVAGLLFVAAVLMLMSARQVLSGS